MKLSALFSPDGLQFVRSADVVLSAGHCSRWKRDRVLSDEDDDVDVRMKGGKSFTPLDQRHIGPGGRWDYGTDGGEERDLD